MFMDSLEHLVIKSVLVGGERAPVLSGGIVTSLSLSSIGLACAIGSSHRGVEQSSVFEIRSANTVKCISDVNPASLKTLPK